MRAEFDRPVSAEGDPEAQRRLCANMELEPPAWLRPSILARTRFVDDQVQAAIWAGICQIVICGAGYDDRALRFRTPGVRFFELDHPGTQEDKASRLRAIGADTAVTLAAADFSTDNAGEVLAAAGHDSSRPSLIICEGLLVYLDQQTCHRLLTSLAGRAGRVSRAGTADRASTVSGAGTAGKSAAGSHLAVSIATHADGFDSDEVVATANARRRTAAAEPWRTILPAREHLALLTESGWAVTGVTDSPAAGPRVSHGSRTLLVTAVLDSPTR